MKGISVDADAGWTPLYLSTLAGMSTCLGALIVFCHPIEEEENDEESAGLVNDGSSSPSRLRKRMSGRRKVSPSTMAFSLALAGSVMVTVSVVSIGPECLAASSMPKNSQNTDLDTENSFFVFGITLMPILSWEFLHRLLSFGAGALLYFLMSKFAFPEPEEILSTHLESVQQSSSLKSSSLTSGKSSDDEHDNPSTNSPLPDKAIGVNLNNSLQRRGTNTEDVEMATISTNGRGKRKGLFRRPRSNPFTSCMTSLRVFTKGTDLDTPEARRANRVAMLLFFSLLIHNFPEGLAVAASALESDQLGMTVTIGVMIHNIPEGIAIAIPCLKARPDSPWLAFFLASVSGLAEPAGAFVSLVLLRGVERRQTGGGVVEEGDEIGGEGMLENVLGFVAGIMITVSFLELFPEAKRHAEKSGMKAYYGGLVVGFLVMIATEFGMSL